MKHEDVRPTPPNVMTSEDRLRFAVRFVQMDLDTLRPGDWLNLHEDILGFLSMTTNDFPMEMQASFPIPEQPAMPGAIDAFVPLSSLPLVCIPEGETSLSPEEYRVLQADVGAWLRPLSRFATPMPAGVLSACPSVPLQVGICFCLEKHFAEGGLRQLFMYHLLVLLLREPFDRIRACPECETIFYRVKQQAYCSRTCGNRATQRRWRERHEAGASPIA